MIEGLLRIYRYSGLIQVLVLRELKVRYRRTVLGLFWSFVNPLVLMLTYVLVFSVYFRVGMPHYSVYLLCGLLPWMCFSSGFVEATHSIINNAGLIKKVSLPSEIFPLVAVASNMVHYVLSLPILLLFLAWFGFKFSYALVLFPVVLAVQLTFTYGLALVASSLVVSFRDLLHIVPNLLMVWMFVTPIIYAPEMVPARYRPLLDLNPMTGIIGAYHDIFFYGRFPPVQVLTVLAGVSFLVLVLGMAFFNARKDVFAEEI